VQGDQVTVFQHRRPDSDSFRRDLPPLLAGLFRQEPVQVARGECRVVPRQRRQHLIRIGSRRLIGPADGLGPLDDLRPGDPHPHRSDMLLRVRGPRVDPRLQPVLAKILVLMLAPEFAPHRAV